MKTLIFSFIALFSLIFLLQSASAQTVLQPGEAEFEVLGIVLEPLPTDNDFTGTQQGLSLYGDLYYLNVRWSARYSDGMEREIGVECYLNCPNPDQNISNNCIVYKNSTNYCNFKALTGYGFCTIVRPGYLFKNQINNITCRFYNPATPDIEYLPYPNRTFKPIDFTLFSTPNATITVGKPFVLPLNVRTIGFFVNNFTLNVSALLKPYLVIIENPISQTESLKYNQIGKVYPKITFLSAEKINFKVLAKPIIDPTTCSMPSDCEYFGAGAECINSKCWKRITVEIDAGMSSLPEFGWAGFLQIMFLATVVILMKKIKIR